MGGIGNCMMSREAGLAGGVAGAEVEGEVMPYVVLRKRAAEYMP